MFLSHVKPHYLKGGIIKKDRNDKPSVILSVLAGKCPESCQYMAGTIAEMYDLEVHGYYLINTIDSGHVNEYGPVFKVEVIEKLDTKNMLMSLVTLPEREVTHKKDKKIDERDIIKQLNE